MGAGLSFPDSSAGGARAGGPQPVSGGQTAEPPPHADAAARRAVATLLDDPVAGLGITTFDGVSRSVTSLRVRGRSDGRCKIAVLLTGDRGGPAMSRTTWGCRAGCRGHSCFPTGQPPSYPTTPDDAVVLHPDGSTTRLTVSTDPMPADRNSWPNETPSCSGSHRPPARTGVVRARVRDPRPLGSSSTLIP
jgi:hypothetical protein